MYLAVMNLLKEKNILKKSSLPKEEKVTSMFYEETKITIMLSVILGAQPIAPDKTGIPRFKWISVPTIYSLIVFGAASVNAWFVVNVNLRVLRENNEKIQFDDKITFISGLFFLGYYFITIFSIFECKKKAEFYATFNKFEEKYFKITKKRLNCKMMHLQYVFFFALLLISIFIVFFMIRTINRLDVKYNLNTSLSEIILMGTLCMYCLWIVSSCLADWIFVTLGIRKSAEVLLNDLKNFRLRSHLFDELYGLWLELRYLTEDFGNVFCITYIYYLCYTFMIVMVSTYSFLTNVTIVETDNKYEYVISAVVTFVAFGMIGDNAHRTIHQLGNEFHQELLKILAKERDPTTIKGIKWFLQTITLNPPVISLSGYVSLDRGFNVAMLGTLATYIVVVLQFRPTSHQSENSTVVSNVTNQAI